MKLTFIKQYPYLVHLLLILLLSGVITLGLFGARFQSHAISKARGFHQASSERKQYFSLARQGVTQLAAKQDVLERALPNEVGILDFVTTLENTAARLEVKIQSFRFTRNDPVPETKTAYYVPFSLEVLGTFEALTAYLDTLTQLPFVIVLTDIEGLITENFFSSHALHIAGKVYVSSTFRQ